jgi:hypothetical protein
MKLQQMEMPEGKYSRKVFGLPKIKSSVSKEKAVLIKTSEKRRATNNEYLQTSPYGKMTNLIEYQSSSALSLTKPDKLIAPVPQQKS